MDRPLAAALEREHYEIDGGIEAYTAQPTGQRARQQLTLAIRALRRHIYLEEEFVFPPFRAAGEVAAVAVMLREHGKTWATLDSLEQALARSAPSDTTLALCRQLTVQLQHHNLKEEKILYSQVDTALPATAAARLAAFLESGELPEGWVCAKAPA